MNHNRQIERLFSEYEELVSRKNEEQSDNNNGICRRYKYPVLTAAHIPLTWRYDLNPQTNPYSLLPKAIAVSTISDSGNIPSICRKPTSRKPMCTTYGLPCMKTGGYTASSA